MRTLFISLSLLLLVTACDIGFKGEMVAETDSGEMIITNLSNLPVHYFAGEESGLAAINLDLNDHIEWPNLQPGEKVIFGYSELMFYDEGDQSALVFWVAQNGENGHFRVTLN